MRSNPRKKARRRRGTKLPATIEVGKHPDLFKDRPTPIKVTWQEFETEVLEEMAAEGYLDQAVYDQIQEDDPLFFEQLEEIAEETREDRIEDLVKELRETAEYIRDNEIDDWALNALQDRHSIEYMIEGLSLEHLFNIALEWVDDKEMAQHLFDTDPGLFERALHDVQNMEVETDWGTPGHDVITYEEIEKYEEEVRLNDMTHSNDWERIRTKWDIDAIVDEVDDGDEIELEGLSLMELQSFSPTVYLYVKNDNHVSLKYTSGVGTDIDEIVEENRPDEDEEIEQEEAYEAEHITPGPDNDTIVYEYPDGFYVAKLSPAEMIVEGDLQGMCIGAPSSEHPYRKSVRDGEALAFSLRTPEGRSKLTLYADLWTSGSPAPFGKLGLPLARLMHLWEAGDPHEEITERIVEKDLPKETGLTLEQLLEKLDAFMRFRSGESTDLMDNIESIEQVKGKGNRLPGFDGGSHGEISHVDELEKLLAFLKHIKIGPMTISDVRPGYMAMEAYYEAKRKEEEEKKRGKQKKEATVLKILEDEPHKQSYFMDFYPGLPPSPDREGHPARYVIVTTSFLGESADNIEWQTDVYRASRQGKKRENISMWSLAWDGGMEEFVKDQGYDLKWPQPRENPAKIPVSKKIQRMAEKAYNDPFGGEW